MTEIVMAQPTQPQYQQLLEERIAAGRRLVHALVHPEASAEVDALYRAVQRSEGRLTRFRRYSHDQITRVVPEEDAAFHDPDEGLHGSVCTWCARRELAISTPIPLPAQAHNLEGRRSA